MGGFGSGRKFGANVTEDYRYIDIRRWQRDGYLTPGRYLNWQWTRNGEKIATIRVKIETGQLRLIYKYQANGSNTWEDVDYPVGLQTTPCHYGGIRYWFTCPAVGCGRRIAILYAGGKYFACRHCYQLAYQCQREFADDRASRRANKIRDKLNWNRGILNPIGCKPKGMHWKTFCQLLEKYNGYSNQALIGITEKLGILNNRFTNIKKQMRQ
jgi:hypothetical protein